MKIPKILLITLALGIASISLIGCRSAPETPEYQVVTVQRGDLTIDITAVGNLAFSHREELTFEAPGTVGEVLVEAGDSVEEGQVLAKLDDTSITSLQEAVAQARVNLEGTEENLENAENPSKLDVAQAQADVANARVALEAAQEALETAENPYSESDITHAELAVTDAEIALEEAQDALEFAEAPYGWPNKADPLDVEQKEKQLAVAEFDLAEAEEDLAEMLAGSDSLEVDQKQKQLTVAQADLAEAEDALADLLDSVDSLEVELKRSEVASAQAALDEAISYAKNRIVRGKPMSNMQGIRWEFADMHTKIEACRWYVYRTAMLHETNDPSFQTEASACKIFVQPIINDVMATALRIHGAYGYTLF